MHWHSRVHPHMAPHVFWSTSGGVGMYIRCPRVLHGWYIEPVARAPCTANDVKSSTLLKVKQAYLISGELSGRRR